METRGKGESYSLRQVLQTFTMRTGHGGLEQQNITVSGEKCSVSQD